MRWSRRWKNHLRPGRSASSGFRKSNDLKQTRGPLASTHTHRNDDVLDSPSAALNQGVPCQASAADTVWVPNRNCAAVDIEPVVGNAELVRAIQHLHRKSFVQLPQPDILHLEASTLEELWHGEYRPDPHLIGLAARDGEAAEDAERLQSASLRESGVNHNSSRSAVGEL